MKTILNSLLVAGCTLLPATLVEAQSCCATTNESSCSIKLPAIEFTSKSIYQVESEWTTDSAAQIKLGKLAGRPQVVAMFFASCQFTCPVTLNDLKRIEQALKPETRGRVGFTMVSFDTQRDIPAKLAEYRLTHKLSANDWTLLRGESEDVLELAALLGIKYKQDAQGNYAHSNVIVVLNEKGEIIHRLIGLNQDVDETVRIIENLKGNEYAITR
jgi:protein SCO1/2